jgi:hypothetical protein
MDSSAQLFTPPAVVPVALLSWFVIAPFEPLPVAVFAQSRDEPAAVEVTAATDPLAGAPTELDAAGADTTFATTTNESVPTAVAAGKVNVTGVLHAALTRHVGTVPTVMEVASRGVADAGATALTKPKPKVETATSAMRLRVVFVDICFLSIVDPRAFPESAW